MMMEYDKMVVPIDKIIDKNTSQLTMQDVLSLAIHTVNAMRIHDVKTCSVVSESFSTELSTSSHTWDTMYEEFQSELLYQTTIGWPILTIINNSIYKRKDVLSMNVPFMSSSNFLVYIIRIIYVELMKEKSARDEYKCVMFNHPFDDIVQEPVKQLTAKRLFNLVRMALMKYLRIYREPGTFEYELGKRILSMM
jgi:hypothetical protein